VDKAKDAASRVNVELCHRKQWETLSGIMQLIESYEPTEMTNNNDELYKVRCYLINYYLFIYYLFIYYCYLVHSSAWWTVGSYGTDAAV
jgi:hypothetical protein